MSPAEAVHRELLYSDDLIISAESMEELLVKWKRWKSDVREEGSAV